MLNIDRWNKIRTFAAEICGIPQKYDVKHDF